MITVSQVATTKEFQAIALVEALKVISAKTGISYESLFEQLPTNANLQASCAKMLIAAAQETANMMSA